MQARENNYKRGETDGINESRVEKWRNEPKIKKRKSLSEKDREGGRERSG